MPEAQSATAAESSHTAEDGGHDSLALGLAIAGLDMNYRQEPFGAMPRLLAMADEVAKLKAVCHTCGEAAMYTQRLVDGAARTGDT